jgi:hypothetical protein
MPTNRSFFSQFIGSLIGFRPRSPSSGSPIKPVLNAPSARRRSTSSLNSSGGGTAKPERDRPLSNGGGGGEKWWIGARRADGSERYYPIAPLRYHLQSVTSVDGDVIIRRIDCRCKYLVWNAFLATCWGYCVLLSCTLLLFSCIL